MPGEEENQISTEPDSKLDQHWAEKQISNEARERLAIKSENAWMIYPKIRKERRERFRNYKPDYRGGPPVKDSHVDVFETSKEPKYIVEAKPIAFKHGTSIYKAQDLETGRLVALKTSQNTISTDILRKGKRGKLPPGSLDHGIYEYHIQFHYYNELEAKTLARLTHPGIVKVIDSFDAAVSENCPEWIKQDRPTTHEASVLVMELLDQDDWLNLSDLLEDNRDLLRGDDAISLIRQLSDTFDFMHGLGYEQAKEVAQELAAAEKHGEDQMNRYGRYVFELVYNDAKPSNIMVKLQSNGGGELELDRREHVVVIDFGAVNILKHEYPQGTYGYIAPERYASDGGIENIETDVFSLGVTFYELLLGFHPFEDIDDIKNNIKTFPQLLQDSIKAGGQPLSIRTLQKQGVQLRLPKGIDIEGDTIDRIDAIFAKAMATNPDERYHSAGEFAEELIEAINAS